MQKEKNQVFASILLELTAIALFTCWGLSQFTLDILAALGLLSSIVAYNLLFRFFKSYFFVTKGNKNDH